MLKRNGSHQANLLASLSKFGQIKKQLYIKFNKSNVRKKISYFKCPLVQSWVRGSKITLLLAPVRLFQKVLRLVLSRIFQQKNFTSLAFRVIAYRVSKIMSRCFRVPLHSFAENIFSFLYFTRVSMT